MEISNRDRQLIAQVKQLREQGHEQAEKNVDYAARIQHWPQVDIITVKMMLGLTESPEPKERNRKH